MSANLAPGWALGPKATNSGLSVRVKTSPSSDDCHLVALTPTRVGAGARVAEQRGVQLAVARHATDDDLEAQAFSARGDRGLHSA